MNAKKPDPTPSERNAARIAALERECAGWIEAADRFRRECDDLADQLADIKALLPPPEADDQGIVSRVRLVVDERVRARTLLDGARMVLTEIEKALPPAQLNEFGLAQRVKGIVARSAPRTEPAPLTDRDRAILAPLLDILDADLFNTDAGRALAAVRAVVGVERG